MARIFSLKLCCCKKIDLNCCIYRPREAKVNPDGVGERSLRDGIRDLEGVWAEDGCHGGPIGARGLWGGVGLIVLETDPEEGFTFTLLLIRRGETSLTAVFVALYSFLVQKLLQLQLKNSRTKPLWRKEADYHKSCTLYRLSMSVCCDYQGWGVRRGVLLYCYEEIKT